jgi:hypothetical protein
MTAAAAPPAARSVGRIQAVLQQDGLLIAILGVYAMIVLIRLHGELVQDGWLAFVGGREVAHHGIPHHDQLNYWTLGHRWVDQPWLGQLFFYGVVAAGSVSLALFVHAAFVIGAFGLAFVAARALGGTTRSVSWVAPFSILPIAQSDAMRTQTLVYGLFVVVVWLLARDSRAPSSAVFLCLPLLALWANLHGSVVLGAALVCLRGLAAVVEAVRSRVRPSQPFVIRTAVLLGAPLLCVLVSPYGFSLVHYYRVTLNNPGFTRMITEWQATTLTVLHIPFFVLAFAAAWLMGRNRGLTLFDCFALVFTLIGGFLAIRNMVWFGFTALILLPLPLGRVLPARTRPAPHRLSGLVALAGGLALLVGLANALREGRFQREFPASGADAIATVAARDPHARIYASLRFADWLLWREPQLRGRIAYDTRLELLSNTQLTQIYNWGNQLGSRWRSAAAGARVIVLHVNDELGVERSLLRDGGLRRVYRDRHLSVLVRTS